MEQNWMKHLEPLMAQYDKKKHPLDYKSRYQLLVMVILSAQDSDKHINELTPAIFETYPSMNSLAKAATEDLHRYISTVSNFGN